MNVRLLRASGWRNLEPVALEPGPRATVFFGHNGQGKTNLLEAAHYLVEFRSFRTAHPDRAGAAGGEPRPSWPPRSRSAASTGGSTSGGSGPAARKQVRVDGKACAATARSCAAWGWWCSCPRTCCCPGPPPAARRSFLDRAAYNADRLFYAEAVAYQKVLTQPEPGCSAGRTANPTLLDTYDEQLAPHRRPPGDAPPGHRRRPGAPGAGAVRGAARRDPGR